MINHLFEYLMAWNIDNGVFYLTGRDIACAMAGTCAGIIFGQNLSKDNHNCQIMIIFV